MFVLALAWQLMRAHVTKFLAELDLGESDVLEWAAAQTRRNAGSCGAPFAEPASFSDKAFRSGVFLLEVLRAVAPECVDASQILAGESEEEAKANATYAISCAHKMGCTVFLVWEDLVLVRAKLVMCLLAAVMAEGLRRDAQEAAAGR